MRINLYAGPGKGKSALASKIYHYYKTQHKQIELVQEHVKKWAYKNKVPSGWDQVILLGRQMAKEQDLLRNNIKLLVTDAPLFLSVCYSEFYSLKGAAGIEEIVNEYDAKEFSIDIFLNTNYKLQNTGRFQKDEDEANKIHEYIKIRLKEHNKCYWPALKDKDIYEYNGNFEELIKNIETELSLYGVKIDV